MPLYIENVFELACGSSSFFFLDLILFCFLYFNLPANCICRWSYSHCHPRSGYLRTCTGSTDTIPNMGSHLRHFPRAAYHASWSSWKLQVPSSLRGIWITRQSSGRPQHKKMHGVEGMISSKNFCVSSRIESAIWALRSYSGISVVMVSCGIGLDGTARVFGFELSIRLSSSVECTLERSRNDLDKGWLDMANVPKLKDSIWLSSGPNPKPVRCSGIVGKVWGTPPCSDIVTAFCEVIWEMVACIENGRY